MKPCLAEPLQKAQIGFYFHIPFCPHICPYCDFVKTSRFQKKDVTAYLRRTTKLLSQHFTAAQ